MSMQILSLREPSHHHQPGPPPFGVSPGVSRGQHIATRTTISLACRVPCVTFAVRPPHDFEVIVPQGHPARVACETARVELCPPLRLQVLTLDAVVAGSAKGAVELMVMMTTVRVVVNDVKVSSLEGGVASPANEACADTR